MEEDKTRSRRVLQQHPSVGDILLDMVNPGFLSPTEKIGVTTIARQPGSISSPSSSSGVASPTEMDLFSRDLEAAWHDRSLFRPRKEVLEASKGAPFTPETIFARLPQQPPSLLASLRAGRGRHPLDPGAGSRESRAKSVPLLALLHPASLAWPARLDILVTALTALESAEAGSGDFDLVVVLDSPGQNMGKHDCNAKASTMMTPAGEQGPGLGGGGKTLLCDSFQLLEQSGVPFVFAQGLPPMSGDAGGKKRHQAPRAARRRRRRRRRRRLLAEGEQQLDPSSSSTSWTSSLTAAANSSSTARPLLPPRGGGGGGGGSVAEAFDLGGNWGGPRTSPSMDTLQREQQQLLSPQRERPQAEEERRRQLWVKGQPQPKPKYDGAALQREHARLMAGAAAIYARDHGYTELVIAVSSSLIGSGAVAALADAVKGSSSGSRGPDGGGAGGGSGGPVVVVPVLAGSSNALSASSSSPSSSSSAGSNSGGGGVGCGMGGEHGGACLRALFPSLPPALVAFAEHPLSFQRTSRALQRAFASTSTSTEPESQARFLVDPAALASKSSSSTSTSSCAAVGMQGALGLVAGLSTATALRLMGLESAPSGPPPQPPPHRGWPVIVTDAPALPLDDCAALDAVGAAVRVHKAAFAVAHTPSHVPQLLKNDPTPHRAALLHTPEPASLKGPKTGPAVDAAATAAAATPRGPKSAELVQAQQALQSLSPSPESGTLPPAARQRSPTLVVATCAGVWHRTLSLLLSFEGSRRDHFDFLLAVTPRDTDTSDEFARAAGIATLVQPEPVGLTDLWNQIVKYAFAHDYQHLFIVNNDVLPADGAVSALVSTLEAGANIVTPGTRFGAGILQCPLYGSGGRKGDPAAAAGDTFISNPLNFARVGAALVGPPPSSSSSASSSKAKTAPPLPPPPPAAAAGSFGPVFAMSPKVKGKAAVPESGKYGALSTGTFMAFFFGMRTQWAKTHLLDDGTLRLWNDTRWKNYNQEASLSLRTQVKPYASYNSFVFHFRGSTLEPGPCKNGWLDCAKWQKGHRPDMDSQWFNSKKTGLRKE